jgi:hypothetical protein
MNFRCVLLILLVSTAFAGVANAATLHVIVSGISEDAKACGLSEDLVNSAAKQAIKARSIGISQSLTNPYLNVDLRIVSTTDTCIAFLVVSIDGLGASDNADVPIGGFRAPDSRVTRLGEFGSTVTEMKGSGFARRIMDELAKNIKIVLQQVKY